MRINAAVYLLLTLLCASPLSACAGVSGGPIDGVVREESTNKPIPGAIVVVLWKHHQGYSGTVCYHVETATADESGRYHIPKWSNPSDTRTLKDPYIAVDAYKSGYGLPTQPSQKREEVLLAPFTGGRAERLEYLLRVSSGTRCGTKDESEKNLLPLKKALYEEGASAASNERDQEKIETLLFGMESLQYGNVEALNRMNERRKARK